MTRGVFLLGVLVLCSACGSLTGPGSDSLSGSWTGVTSGSSGGPGAVQTTIGQSGSALSGTWGAQYANPLNNSSGSLSGKVSGDTVTLTLSPSVPTSCPYTVTAIKSGETLAGTFATFNCQTSQSGTVRLARNAS
jgi:hypothetical protein